MTSLDSKNYFSHGNPGCAFAAKTKKITLRERDKNAQKRQWRSEMFMKIKNMEVSETFNSYPKEVRDKLEYLRSLIMEVAKEEGIENIEEALKWGEPSYVSKMGSAIRIDWKKKTPNQYSMYFNCKTKLVSTFKEIYPDSFSYAGNREIYFKMSESLPTKELKHCIYLSLNYHKIKQLPLLGA